MNTNTPSWLRAALLALVSLPLAAHAAAQEIPITTTSAEAKLAFDAGQAALDRGDATQANDVLKRQFVNSRVDMRAKVIPLDEFISVDGRLWHTLTPTGDQMPGTGA